MKKLQPKILNLNEKRFFTYNEAAAYYNVSVSTIRKMAMERNAIRAFGRSKRIDRMKMETE